MKYGWDGFFFNVANFKYNFKTQQLYKKYVQAKKMKKMKH